MINYDSILSAFDGKPTLLQWLKMVKKALDESILKNVNITQNGQKVVFTFNFEDGTSISTPEVTLPKGATGPKGDTGATGPKGDNGVSITGINTVGSEVVGDETLTTLRANYSNDTTNDFIVSAKNGKDGIGVLYYHVLKISNSDETKNIYFSAYSAKENLTLEDALSFIPVNMSGNIVGYFNNNNDKKVTLISKIYGVTGQPTIRIEYNGTLDNFIAEKIVDTKLGENL